MKYILLFLLTLSLHALDQNATFSDQFDQKVRLSKEDEILIVVFDKAGYYDVLDFLDTKSKDYLSTHHIRFVNDISGMPESIYTLFVQPRMQRLPYQLYLVRDDKLSKSLNYEENKITLYILEKNQIKHIRSEEIQYILPK